MSDIVSAVGLRKERLAEIKARADAATPGPWFVAGPPWNVDEPYILAGQADPHAGSFICDLLDPSARDDREALEPDAEFIAHARSDVPDLLVEVARLQTELREKRR